MKPQFAIAAVTLLAASQTVSSTLAAEKSSPKAIKTAASTVNAFAFHDPQAAKKTVAFWESRVRYDPQGAIGYSNLATAYLALSRESNDISHAVRAEAAARQSLKLVPDGNASALSRLSRALMTQHRFPEALAIANRAVVFDPQQERARADILLELGQYPAAEKAYQAAYAATEPEDRIDDLNLLTLRARILDSKGQGDAAMQLMQQARRKVNQMPDTPPETAAWYHVMVGHGLIDGGDLKAGEAACWDALKIFPRDHRAITGLAEAAAWRGDHLNALKWGRKALQIVPQNPGILRLVGEAYEATGNKVAAQREFTKLQKLAASFPRIYDRHWILFLADNKRDLDTALKMAQADLRLRQDSGSYDALMWVYFQKGDLARAKALLPQALKHGAQDPNIVYHAALIARAGGDEKTARARLGRVRVLNPYFDVSAAKKVMPQTKTANNANRSV